MDKEYTPNTIEECFQYFDEHVQDIEKFVEADEDKAMGMAHMGLGMSIRNNWGLWKEDTPLAMWFISHGIKHADDMSGVILTSYHRHKNGKEIDLEGQFQRYKDFWDNLEGGNPFIKEDNT